MLKEVLTPPQWRPDSSGRELAREGGIRAAQMRLVVAMTGALLVTLSPSFPTLIYISGYGVMFAVALGELLLVRRPPQWLNTVTCLFDVTLLNLMNVALALTGSPLAVTNSRAFFTVTILVLSLTCLRQDARLALVTGLMAIAQYALLVVWIVARFDLGSETAGAIWGAFLWSNQLTRFALLAVATAINVVIINTSRSYWRDSVHDWLTGLVNRRYAEKRLEEALAAAHRTRRELVIALVDIDHFKRINDTFGHAAGDRVLCTIAAALQQTFRSSDVVARFGGDEFFILFPDGNVTATLDRVARFHTAFSLTEPTPITLSIGTAAWPADGDDAAALFAAADQRLYAAKESGRGRMVMRSNVTVSDQIA